MIYLESFKLLDFFEEERTTDMPTVYPFGLFSEKGLLELSLLPITILYGNNGSGKSTLLNIIGEKIKCSRKTEFYSDEHFRKYVHNCDFKMALDEDNNFLDLPKNCKLITSEDIMSFILDIRKENIRVDQKRKELSELYVSTKYNNFKYRNLSDYDELSLKSEVLRKTQTSFIRSRVNNIKQFSNGENVLRYFDSELENDGLYLLDEPENSLSPEFQIELVKLIQECSRYCGCQFIISTHSPFILSLNNAKIYNLDINPVSVDKWTDLKNVRFYFDFFKKYEDEF